MSKMMTDIIRYNLKDRMRQFNGQERHFNVPALVKNINSDRMQERVKFGDLHGYYGHWARTKFGAEPKEGGVIDGKVVNLEPCFRTVHLKAYDDGTIEHKAEFFDNDPGRKAWALVQNNTGGFSSVIQGNEFHGFDMVFFPNYNKNRPYDPTVTLDDGTTEVIDDTVLVLDEVGDELDPRLQLDYIEYLQDSIKRLKCDCAELEANNQLLDQTIAHLEAQNELLVDDVLTLKAQAEQAKKSPLSRTRAVATVALDDVISQAERFKTAKLEKLEEPEESKTEKAMREFNRRWGI